MKLAKYLLIMAIAFAEMHCSSGNIKLESKEKSDSNTSTSVEKSNANLTKYVFAVIYHKRGRYVSSENKSGFEGPIENYLYYSDIVEATEVNETAKYKILDKLEDELRNQFGYSVHSITKRECLVFDTYIEASEYRRKIRN